MQKITDDPLTTCIFCNGQVKKLVSNCSFQLKGTGWYATDYAGKSNSSEEKKKVKKKDSTEKATDTNTEKKTSQETAVNQ
jgi:predicted nucleic acid-binding Zn ribbon protein